MTARHRTSQSVVFAAVPWSDSEEITRGQHHGLPVMFWGDAPRTKLATRRQLRALGLRPGGQEPVAYLRFHCRRACTVVYAELFLIELAKPKGTATPAQHTALAKANLARRICAKCGRDAFYVLPLEHRKCDTCWHIDEYGTAPEPVAA